MLLVRDSVVEENAKEKEVIGIRTFFNINRPTGVNISTKYMTNSFIVLTCRFINMCEGT